MIHLNIGSNLKSVHGTRSENISIAINLLIKIKMKIIKISNFYETPSYPNPNFPKYLNIGLLGIYNFGHDNLFKEISLIEKKLGRVKSKKNAPRTLDIDVIDFNSLIIKNKSLELLHPRAPIVILCFIQLLN